MAKIDDILHFTIVIPAYNREALIRETLDSVHGQTWPHWECIVVDDGSEDQTCSIVEEYQVKNPRFKLIQRHELPKGASHCRNIGLAAAQSNLIIFLDSDDLITSTCLENRAKWIKQHPEFDFWVFPTAQFSFRPGDSTKRWNQLHKKENDLVRFLLQDPPWNTMGPVWTKIALHRIGGFDQDAVCWQDWEMHVRALLEEFTYSKAPEDAVDSYYRKPEKTDSAPTLAISSRHNETAHIKYRLTLFVNLFHLIIHRKGLQQYKQNFGVLFFRLLQEMYTQNLVADALRLITFCLFQGLYSITEALLLYAYLFPKGNRIFKKNQRIVHYLRKKRPFVFDNQMNATFLNDQDIHSLDYVRAIF